MRHGKKLNSLGRTASHRKAMMANMACSLIEHKRINTTLAKAKALRTYLEPIITKSKVDSTHSRRIVFSYLKNKEAVTELFREISPKVIDRQGGYLRIIKLGFRQGDSAEMCMIELVDFNEIYTKGSADASKKTRRSRRGGGKTSAANETSNESSIEEATVVEAPKKAEAKKTEAKAEEKKEAPKKAEAKITEAKAEEKKEAPKKAEAKKTEAKTEEKKEAPKKDDKKENEE